MESEEAPWKDKKKRARLELETIKEIEDLREQIRNKYRKAQISKLSEQKKKELSSLISTQRFKFTKFPLSWRIRGLLCCLDEPKVKELLNNKDYCANIYSCSRPSRVTKFILKLLIFFCHCSFQ